MAARLLVDSHVLLWMLAAPDRLSKPAHELLSDRANHISVSAATAWEIATKQRLGKLPEADALVLGYTEHLERLGIAELAITSRHALVAGALGWAHRDPFDRILAAQSMLESLPLVTADRVFAGLAGLRVVW